MRLSSNDGVSAVHRFIHFRVGVLNPFSFRYFVGIYISEQFGSAQSMFSQTAFKHSKIFQGQIILGLGWFVSIRGTRFRTLLCDIGCQKMAQNALHSVNAAVMIHRNGFFASCTSAHGFFFLENPFGRCTILPMSCLRGNGNSAKLLCTDNY